MGWWGLYCEQTDRCSPGNSAETWWNSSKLWIKESVLQSGRFVPLLFSNNSFGPPGITSGISITQWSLTWLQTTWSKNGIMYFEDQDLSWYPRAGSAVSVHRRLEPWPGNQKGLNIQECWHVSSFSGPFWPPSFLLCLCFSAFPPAFLLFLAHDSRWLPHSGCLSRRLTSSESWLPFEAPCSHSLGESVMVSLRLRRPISLGWGGSGACSVTRVSHMCHTYGCWGPWEVQFFEPGVRRVWHHKRCLYS